MVDSLNINQQVSAPAMQLYAVTTDNNLCSQVFNNLCSQVFATMPKQRCQSTSQVTTL